MQKSDIMINLPTMGQRDHNNIKEPYGAGGGGDGGNQATSKIPQTQFLSFNTSGASLEVETNCSNTNIL